MQITRTRQTQRVERRSRKRSPATGSRALVVQEKMAQPRRARHTGWVVNPNRCDSAFLAHLSLQYDGISVQRRRRAERLKAAIQSYVLDAAARSNPRARSTRDLRI